MTFLKKREDLISFLIRLSLINTFIFWIIGIKYLQIILSSRTYFATSFYSYNSFFSKSTVIFFTFVSFIGQFTLLAFLPLIIIVLPFIILFNNKLLTYSLALFVGILSIFILLADSIVFSNFHFHLNFSILEIFSNKNIFEFLGLSNYEILLSSMFFLLIIVVEIFSVFLIAKRVTFKIKKITCILFSCLVISYGLLIASIQRSDNVFSQQTPNLPLYNNILAMLLPVKNAQFILECFSETKFSQPLFPVHKLHYPLHALQFNPQKNKLNVILIAVDALRFDALNKTLMPSVSAFAENALQFKNHFSGGNSTQAGIFSLFYGLPSNYWASMSKEKKSSLLLDSFMQHGYDMQIMFSSAMIPHFDENAFSHVPNLRTQARDGAIASDQDRSLTKNFLQFLDQRKSNKPFFAFLLYNSVHNYCDPQNFKKLYAANHDACMRIKLIETSPNKNLQLHYLNAVHFVDEQINLILQSLKEKKLLDNTMIIFTSDHGEEFNDNHQGYLGHGSNYTSYQIKTPLVIYIPHQTGKIFTHKTSHYDVSTFLMQNVLNCSNPTSDYSVGKNLFDKSDRPYLIVGSYINMAIVEKDRSTTLFTSGNIKVADNEAVEIPNASANTNLLKQALNDMRKFYYFTR